MCFIKAHVVSSWGRCSVPRITVFTCSAHSYSVYDYLVSQLGLGEEQVIESLQCISAR